MATKNPPSLAQIIKSEHQLCIDDPVHFMKKYCHIQHPVRGKIPFHLYDFQMRSLEDFKKHQFNIILKSRQLGISTLTSGYALWLMMFHHSKEVLVIATKQDVAKNIVTKVKFMYESLPNWLKQMHPAPSISKLAMEFANGSRIKAVSSSEDAGRSEALSLLILDEAAFISEIDEIWKSSYSTLSTGGQAIILSTPNGAGNFFHQKWVEATTDPSTKFNSILLHWTVHPDRDDDWREEQTQLLGPKGAAQECDCDFIASGNTVIDGELIQWYKDTFVEDPKEQSGPDGNYWKWDWPDYSKQYMVVADVARGDGTDSSAFHVIDLENSIQVASYKGKIPTKEFGNFLVAVAHEWNDALLVIENASVGWAAIQPAIDRGYPNLFYGNRDMTVVDTQQQLSAAKDLLPKDKLIPGFSTTAKTRPMIISKLDQYMREKAITIKDVRTIEELFVFVWVGNNVAKAQRGYNDDLVMSLSIGLWIRDTSLRLRQQGIELTKTTLGYFKNTSPIYKSGTELGKKTWEMSSGKTTEDISWLLDKKRKK